MTGFDWVRHGLAVTEYAPGADAEGTIVALSSLGVSRRCWGYGAGAELGRTHRVLAVDLPGHGTSPPADHFLTISDFATAIARMLDAEGIGNVGIIGNSMGATIGTALADERPDLVTHLVHVGSAVWASEVERRDWLHSRSGLFCGPEGGREMARDFVEAIFGRYDEAWYRMLREDQRRSGIRLGWAMWALYAYDTAAALGRITHPVLAVFGENDPYREVSLPVLRRHLGERLDEVIVPAGSHLLPVDRGPELAGHIRNWLSSAVHGVTREMA
jgi:pimeloyl-ACP methyl ester carboxylesterase